MGEQKRFQVRREPGPPHDWLVVDTETDEAVESYGRRSNWIDGHPYGPKAAAQIVAHRLNEGRAASTQQTTESDPISDDLRG